MSIRHLLQLAVPYRVPLFAIVILTILSSLVMLAIPWLAGRMFGGILLQQSSVSRVVALLIVALVVLTALKVSSQLLSATTAARLLAELRERVYAHIQALPIAFHYDRRQGDTLALATFEVSRLGQFLTATLVSLPSRVLTAGGAVILMFQIDAHLALLVPLLVPAFYLILKVVGRRLRRIAIAAQQAEADVVATIERNLTMLPAIKGFAREETEILRYGQQVQRSMRITIDQGRIYALLEPFIGLVAAIGAVLLIFMASSNVSKGLMTNAQLFSFLFYAALLTRPVGALAHLYGEVQSARGTLARLQSVLSEDVEPGYAGTASPAPARGNVSFIGVGFSYPGRPQLLRDVTLDIMAGEKVALVGPNGAGKTTLMNLLVRFNDPDRGTILLDGKDISISQVQALRRKIGVVPQRDSLFNGTIRDNIGYGLEGATEDQIIHAARLSQAFEFIAALPNGFDTAIGDNGVLLSGGQRQRIALARALVKDPPILLLDEAFSMYDTDGEQAFIAASADALMGRTVVFTTHRPASLAIADRIIRVENGTIRVAR